jgi:ATP-dependent 26S proteasome regulatory subunit
MFAIRARRKIATEKDFLAAVDKVIKGTSSSTHGDVYAIQLAKGYKV